MNDWQPMSEAPRTRETIQIKTSDGYTGYYSWSDSFTLISTNPDGSISSITKEQMPEYAWTSIAKPGFFRTESEEHGLTWRPTNRVGGITPAPSSVPGDRHLTPEEFQEHLRFCTTGELKDRETKNEEDKHNASVARTFKSWFLDLIGAGR
jgi:hypothetical protein